MIKDFYKDVLNAFDRKEDKEAIEAVHKYCPNKFMISSDELFFAKNADEIIDGIEFMTRVVRVASRNWKENEDAHNIDVLSYITQIWYDMQYYHYRAFEHYLYDMTFDDRYVDVPEDLTWETRNDHTKQQKAYKEYAKEHGIHDIDSAKAFLEKHPTGFGGLEFGEVKEPETVSE